jgi:serine/threonine protein kinase
MSSLLLQSSVSSSAKLVVFFHYLRQSRLMEDVDIARCERSVPEGDFDAFTNRLVEERLLTQYQLDQIMQGNAEGLMIGQYCVQELIGKGGFGQVYKAYHQLMGRHVALKVINSELIADIDVRNLFRREILAATRVSHPNIAIAYDADEKDGVLYLAMEFVEGTNLETLVVEQGPISTPFATRILTQTCNALQYAHEHGMVHRDIKPANLLLSGINSQEPATDAVVRNAVVKVVDFGLARLLKPGSGVCQTLQCGTQAVGTPAFIAPEQARNVHDADIRSDLYSLGCTLFFALSGQLPFEGETPHEIIIQHLENEPPSLSSVRPDIPPAVSNIVRRLMSKNPDHRFADPMELVQRWKAQTQLAVRPTIDPVQHTFKSLANPLADRKLLDSASPTLDPTVVLPQLQEASAERPPPDENEAAIILRERFASWLALADAVSEGEELPADTEYLSQYRQLRVALKSLHAMNGIYQATALAIETLIEPWVTLRCLAESDEEMLADLQSECEFWLGKLPIRVVAAGNFGKVAAATALVLAVAGSIAAWAWLR